ncbi:hypothetical protein PTH_2490 [Pelotomaculum thermopropionicum SI]|uniref:Uncharacterized protein n=1 Tax=Pelotomaculum thermopropionicum (strain DSM 13744 / JCM 10971 / SI) TaxID=370438 RepID=A5CZA2_PELTS|nr:hypothetical protein PTH_2490 [Pelotomaculum thermopropionicum SI]
MYHEHQFQRPLTGRNRKKGPGRGPEEAQHGHGGSAGGFGAVLFRQAGAGGQGRPDPGRQRPGRRGQGEGDSAPQGRPGAGRKGAGQRMYARLMKNRANIRALLQEISPLIDWHTDDLSPEEFWQSGTYFTHPLRNKAIVIDLYPAGDPVQAAREAAGGLEARTGLALDWAAGVSRTKAGRPKVTMVIKTLAACARTGKPREFRPGPDDLKAVAALERGREKARRRGVRVRERRR